VAACKLFTRIAAVCSLYSFAFHLDQELIVSHITTYLVVVVVVLVAATIFKNALTPVISNRIGMTFSGIFSGKCALIDRVGFSI